MTRPEVGDRACGWNASLEATEQVGAPQDPDWISLTNEHGADFSDPLIALLLEGGLDGPRGDTGPAGPVGLTSSAGASGFISIVGGPILKWGLYSGTLSGTGEGTITFATAFPTACRRIFLTNADGSGAPNQVVSGVTPYGAASVSFTVFGTGAVPYMLNWLAIGD